MLYTRTPGAGEEPLTYLPELHGGFKLVPGCYEQDSRVNPRVEARLRVKGFAVPEEFEHAEMPVTKPSPGRIPGSPTEMQPLLGWLAAYN